MSTETNLIEKAWKDEEFKQQFIDDPKGTLREMGETVPDHLNIQVVEEIGNTRYFVIPQNPSELASDEMLSDADLEAVAGGAAAAEWCSVLGCSGQTRFA